MSIFIHRDSGLREINTDLRLVSIILLEALNVIPSVSPEHGKAGITLMP
jgi:hypothetical protein